MLKRAGEVSVPKPAGEDAKAAKSARPDRRPAVEPWLQQAMTLVSHRPKDPVTASRAYAVVAIAMYDAAVSATHWQQKYGFSSYPSTTAAIAGAGSRARDLLLCTASRTAGSRCASRTSGRSPTATCSSGSAVIPRSATRARR